MEAFLRSPHGRTLRLGDHTRLMGILNVTSDSFYDGGRYLGLDRALRRAEEMIAEGADLIDVGGESTRPGAEPVPLEEELRRVVPVVRAIRERFPEVFLSVDTYKAKVAEEALKAGADMVNDISGLRFDPQMRSLVADWKAPVVIMHIKGTPRDMQKNPYYEDVVRELLDYFRDRMDAALGAGIPEDQIVLDPGIGFGKRLEDNLAILAGLAHFRALGRPLLIGHSRKSFIAMIAGDIPPEGRLPGTLGVTAYCVLKGVEILRVHDVAENRQVVEVMEALRSRIG